MKRYAFALMVALTTTSAQAEVRELSQAELRAAVAEERAIPTRNLVRGVEQFTGGDVLDIRAFLTDENVTYRILYRAESGAIDTIMVNGATGRQVNPNSIVGQTVLAVAGSNPGNGNGNAFGVGNSNGDNGVGNNNGSGNNRNGNRNGRGNGSGGNGNGNGRDR